jgi:hypothetical protein
VLRHYSDDRTTVFVKSNEFKELIPISMRVIETKYPKLFIEEPDYDDESAQKFLGYK